MENNIDYIITDHDQKPSLEDDLYEVRSAIADMHQKRYPVEVTIIVLAYNRIEHTKRCLESIVSNTKGIDYELLLVDNGSTDGTMEYFKGFPFENKKIIRVTNGMGTNFPFTFLNISQLGRYVAVVNNDLMLTKNWLKNLLLCVKSDKRIGMVNPVSSNVSNGQEQVIEADTYEQMQRKAVNISDKKKWQQRLRLITLGTLYTKEALLAIGMPLFDCGFIHNFSDDDISIRIRRAGYKLILAGDTWIHHDHLMTKAKTEDSSQFDKEIESGRRNFRNKYFGIDAWGDISRKHHLFAHYLEKPKKQVGIKILGIDTACGNAILDIKNRFCEFGIYDTKLSAYTQDAKYQLDLKTICDDEVFCDREEFLSDYFNKNTFDYIYIGKSINCYKEPEKVLDKVFDITEQGGIIVLSLVNTYGLNEFLNMLGKRDTYNSAYAYNISPELLEKLLETKGYIKSVSFNGNNFTPESESLVKNILGQILKSSDLYDCSMRLLASEFFFFVEKK